MANGIRTHIEEHVIVNRQGQPVGVYLSLKDYKKLRALAEDFLDHQWFERRKNEKALPFKKVVNELKRKGIL